MPQVIQDKYILGQSSEGNIEIDGDEITLNLQLEPNTNNITGGTISGQVTASSSNAPINNACITLMTNSYKPIANTLTDINGNYTLNNVTPGSYTIFAISTNMLLNKGTNLTVTEFETYNQNFKLTENPNNLLGLITGIVTSKTTNKPLSGAIISLFDNNSQIPSKSTPIPIYTTYTNPYGQYAFRRLPMGNYSIDIDYVGYEPLKNTLANLISRSQIIPLKNKLTPIPLTSGKYGTVSGRIIDSSNTPISEADVLLYKVIENKSVVNGAPTLTPIAYTQTNINGIYLFGGVVPGKYIVKANEIEILNTSV